MICCIASKPFQIAGLPKENRVRAHERQKDYIIDSSASLAVQPQKFGADFSSSHAGLWLNSFGLPVTASQPYLLLTAKL